MSELHIADADYVRCWRVQYAHRITDEIRDDLIYSLAGISYNFASNAPLAAAVEESRVWWIVTAPEPDPILTPLGRLNMRPEALYNALLNPTVEYPPPPRLLLEDAIRVIYEGEKPEMKGLPDEFSKDFPLERFRSLYFDSLFLKREYVCEYRNKKQIRQVYEVKGLLWEDAPSPKPDYIAPQEPAAAPQPPQPPADLAAPKARKKHGAISRREFALLCGVSERLIADWEKGIRTPPEYPGRSDVIAARLFANNFNTRKLIEQRARGADRRPISGGALDDRHTQSAFDED